MRRPRSLALALITALACGPVAADPLTTSPLPRPRPAAAAAPLPAQPPAAPKATPGGVALPASSGQSPIERPQPAGTEPAADPALSGRHPLPRPAAIRATAPAESLPPPADPRLAGARPKPRPAGLAPLPPAETDPVPQADPRLAGHRPKPRPETLAVRPPPEEAPPVASAAPVTPAPAPTTPAARKPPPGGVLSRLFGPPRKRNAPAPEAPAPEAPPARRAEPGLRGSVCGVPGLIGQELPPIGNGGRGSGCGIAEPVRITSVSGLKLSQPMTVDCATATAFKRWVDRGIVPAVGGKGGGVAKLDVGPGYVCRPRNNQRGAKLSEHGHGKAIDLMGLVLRNGQSLDVERGWKSQPRIFRAIHAAACGPFGTVLGPKADRYHQDHIHVDTQRYRSGTYCR
ncbi:extensin family protein [Rhodobacter capsulatus]|uniref:extensin-like domain-containing protein n=1 Tax=Rhodobacter capsulatus TaxID=1061 RepID=UPI0003D3ACA9|nr:extensin family protein [Rhodobacter capsulatus]ETD83857.1 extensin family protein [Rhodobacter capsulatus YW1]